MAAESEGMQKMLPEMKQKRKPFRGSYCSCAAHVCNKILLFIYTICYVIVGLVLMVVGVFVEIERQQIQSLDNRLALPVALLILVGLVIFITALCGCIGTVKENPTLLKVFLVVTVIVFLIQVTIGIIAFIYRQQVPEILSRELMFGVEGYTESSGVKTAMDYIQRQFKCCGFETYEDYSTKNADFSCVSDKPQACGVPQSCCKRTKGADFSESCGFGIIGNASVYTVINTEGCTDAFVRYLAEHLDCVGATALGFSIPQIFGFLLAYYFIRHVQNMRVWYRVDNYKA
ncbi:tetraspanin-15-like [Gigantopelta aegis]|uniref:tetraspanin-15-like n=1 Tax=Gigantopelta aegis TaxID=1735272 RepID=UPI001B88E6AE|nr:tetraspanin-15-like [Gigantopelta aegis]